jgi:dTDP-4-dehydrorhamnose reductase
MRVAVTGASGRLGSALVEALGDAPFTGPQGPIAWSRPELDLDTLTEASVATLIARDRPEVVVHAAAWTDVDACARDPELAMRRNAAATGEIAAACGRSGVQLAVVSTNEIFDGERTDGRGYAPGDSPGPINPYGVSKLEAERRARAAMGGGGGRDWSARGADGGDDGGGGGPGLAIVRTSWLHGPPGNAFPARIAAAARRARDAGEALRVVGDEIGCPTYAPDVAEAIVELLTEDALCVGGSVSIHHLVNSGRASRAAWAREVLRATGIEVEMVEVPSSSWSRDSTPPRWAVLEPTPLPSGEPMRDWRTAYADAVPALLRALRGA